MMGWLTCLYVAVYKTRLSVPPTLFIIYLDFILLIHKKVDTVIKIPGANIPLIRNANLRNTDPEIETFTGKSAKIITPLMLLQNWKLFGHKT